MEIWKPITKGLYRYSNLINEDYEVSNQGRIRNKKTGRVINPFLTQNGKKLRWTMHKQHYYWGGVYDQTLQFLVDKTVYMTFINDVEGKYLYSRIKHKDGNLMNNLFDNLYV